MTQNQLAYWRLEEDKRHNVTTEVETNRHNVRTEDESERHNKVGELNDANRNAETARANKAGEAIKWGELRVKKQEANEKERTNKENEAIKWAQNAETERSNKEDEALKLTHQIAVDPAQALQYKGKYLESLSKSVPIIGYANSLSEFDRIVPENAFHESYKDLVKDAKQWMAAGTAAVNTVTDWAENLSNKDARTSDSNKKGNLANEKPEKKKPKFDEGFVTYHAAGQKMGHKRS